MSREANKKLPSCTFKGKTAGGLCRGVLWFQGLSFIQKTGKDRLGEGKEREGWGGSPAPSLPLDPNIRAPLPIRPPGLPREQTQKDFRAKPSRQDFW